jgi:pimeloyl-ACP methyl ester carboxylesterase
MDRFPLPHEWHGQGEPLLLLSGLGGKGTSWRPFLAHAARRWRVLTLDHRGSGAAPGIEEPMAIADFAADVLRLLDRLGLERVRVIARSMGGMVAQELALAAPDRVERLVLVSTSGRADAHLSQVFLLWARMAEAGVPADVRHQSAMLWCLGRRALERRGAANAYLSGKQSADRPLDYARQARAGAAHHALGRLQRLAAPTLVVAGGDDRLTPVPHAEALAKAIPDAILRVIPEAGHLPYLEEPDRFESVVLPFLERNGSGEGS